MASVGSVVEGRADAGHTGLMPDVNALWHPTFTLDAAARARGARVH
jgi:hypothetical protein